MKYVLPISYQGNGRSDGEAKRLAASEKSRLADFARQFDGTVSSADPLNPRAVFDSEEAVIDFRLAIIELSRIDLQHRFNYYQIYPIQEIPSA